MVDKHTPKAPEHKDDPAGQHPGADGRTVNPRVPVVGLRHDDEPSGEPGSISPPLAGDAAAEATAKAEAHDRVELRKVVILRDYWPLSGDPVLRAVENPTPADAVELPIEEARTLEEGGVAQSADTYPFAPAPPVPPVVPTAGRLPAKD